MQPPESGQASAEITREMIEAGVDVVLSWDDTDISVDTDTFVSQILRAAFGVCPKDPSVCR